MNGGVGTDTVTYANSKTGVTMTLAPTTSAFGTGSGGDAQGDTARGFENLIGSAFADSLRGNDLANIIDGGLGNDIIEGGAGADELHGGNGFVGAASVHTLSYEHSSAGITVRLGLFPVFSGIQQAYGGDAEGDTGDNFSGVIGSGFGDAIYIDLSSFGTVRALGGDDVIDIGAGSRQLHRRRRRQ